MTRLGAFLPLVLVATAHAALLKPRGVHYDLTIGNKVIAPEGFSRSAVLAGLTPETLQLPGPVLTATKGQPISVTVHNTLTDANMRRSTSIHWAGLHLTDPTNDGQSFTSQCPIAPGNSFTYNLDVGDQTGTFFYHSGLSTQYSDGLRGAVIIYDPEDPHKDLYDIDDATTIFQVGEWYHDFAPVVYQTFIDTGSQPIYDAGLINGVGRTNTNPDIPFPVFSVVAGTRYRLRLISNAPRVVTTFSIDQHNLTVIEADGIETEPVNVQAVDLYPGQRYSVVFTANQAVDNYWLRAIPRGGNQAKNPNLNATFAKQIVRYVGAPLTDPVTPAVNVTVVTESQLHPLINPGSPGGPDAVPDLSLVLNFTTRDAGESTPATPDFWAINGTSFQPPTVPTLVQILQNNDDFPATSAVVVVNKGALVELIMPLGEDGGGHPIHLSGQSFDVIQPGDTNITSFVAPSRRDIVPIIGDTTIVRFRADSVGAWALHCHIVWHEESGLRMTFVTDPAQIRATVHPSKEWEDLCSIYDALDPSLQ